MPLRTSELTFDFLAQSLPHIVWVARPDGRHVYYNRRWYEYTGLTPDQSLGQGWSIPLHPDDKQRAQRAWERATASGEHYEVEYRFLGADRKYRWFLARALPVRDASGQVVDWCGTCTDIDDQKRLQEYLQASEDRFRTLTEATPQFVWATQPDGCYTYLSRQWVEYTGLPMAEQVGYQWVNVLHPDDRERALMNWMQAVEGESPYDLEYRIRAADGNHRWFKSRGIPLRDPTGQTTQWLGTCTDIDEQKAAEVALRRFNEELESIVSTRTSDLTRANAALIAEVDERMRVEEELRANTLRLQRSNRELQEFASVASHDLQEPLRKIQAFGDRLGSKYAETLGDQGRDYLSRMQAAAARMSVLISDLLSFSRVSSKAQPFAPVDLGQVALEVLSDLEVRIARCDGRVELGPLPTLEADPTQMRQLFQNLLGNALKFHRDGVPPVVAVEAEVGPRAARIAFRDNGIGFEERFVDRIFNVFQRLNGRGAFEGTGMGLAICRKIVERHGGTLTATSIPGAGSTFNVTLPLHREPGEEPL